MADIGHIPRACHNYAVERVARRIALGTHFDRSGRQHDCRKNKYLHQKQCILNIKKCNRESGKHAHRHGNTV